MNNHLARITWTSAIKELPSGLLYSTVSRFAEDEWEKEAWSIVCEFDTAPIIQGNPSIGRVRFLVSEGPADRLQPGVSFALYEGRREVAVVEVLE